MNKVLLSGTMIRWNKCIIQANNLNRASEATGIAPVTIKKLIQRGIASVEQIKLLDTFCDGVEQKRKKA